MMVNRKRGEIQAVLDEKPYKLCLTLGALAELETALEANSLMDLAKRFERAELSARELALLITCGLRGGGHDIQLDDVLQMHTAEGISGFATIANELLSATFSGPEV